MATLTEGYYRDECFVSSEEFSFEACTVLSGQNLVANTVVGKVTIAGIGRVSVPTVVGSGNGTASLVSAGPSVQVGNYVVTCTAAVAHGGTFSVVAPDGTVLDSFTMGTTTGGTAAYVSDHINFSLTDGSADFAVGDVFTFVVDTTAPTVIGGTGTGTISALGLKSKAQTGNYLVTITEVVANGGRYEVRAPNGSLVKAGAMNTTSTGAATITTDHIDFTLTDATDFIAGNYFNVAVYNPAAAPKVVAWDPTPATYDGRQRVAGVLRGAVDASSGDTAGVIAVRRAVVHGGELQWIATASAGDKVLGKAQLTAMGVVVAAAA